MAAVDTGTVLRVVDVFPAPHGGSILRLKVTRGGPPTVRQVKAARLVARSPEGLEVAVRANGFALFGGRPSDERIARTGMVDVRVESVDGSQPADIGLQWTVRLAS